MFFGAVIFAIVWSLIALFIRKYPETMSGYNTMPKHKREKVDIQKVGRLVSTSMFAVVPSALLSPLMPTKKLFMLLLVGIPTVVVLVVAVFVNVCHKRFEK